MNGREKRGGKRGLQQVLLNQNPRHLPLQLFETFSQLFGHHEDSYAGVLSSSLESFLLDRPAIQNVQS